MVEMKAKVEGLIALLETKERKVEGSALATLAERNVDALKKFLSRLSNDADNSVADEATLALDAVESES